MSTKLPSIQAGSSPTRSRVNSSNNSSPNASTIQANRQSRRIGPMGLQIDSSSSSPKSQVKASIPQMLSPNSRGEGLRSSLIRSPERKQTGGVFNFSREHIKGSQNSRIRTITASSSRTPSSSSSISSHSNSNVSSPSSKFQPGPSPLSSSSGSSPSKFRKYRAASSPVMTHHHKQYRADRERERNESGIDESHTSSSPSRTQHHERVPKGLKINTNTSSSSSSSQAITSTGSLPAPARSSTVSVSSSNANSTAKPNLHHLSKSITNSPVSQSNNPNFSPAKSNNTNSPTRQNHNPGGDANQPTTSNAVPLRPALLKLMPDARKGDLLKSFPLFNKLTEHERDRLGGTLSEHTFPSHAIIMRQGQIGDNFYLILRGKAKVITTNSASEETLMGILGPGDFFGEAAFLTSECNPTNPSNNLLDIPSSYYDNLIPIYIICSVLSLFIYLCI